MKNYTQFTDTNAGVILIINESFFANYFSPNISLPVVNNTCTYTLLTLGVFDLAVFQLSRYREV